MSHLIIRRKSLTLPRWPAAFDRLRVVHVTDLHLRTWNRLLDRLRVFLLEADYDLLLLTGDFGLQPKDWPRTGRSIRRLLQGVRPPLGTFASLGNHDGLPLVSSLESVGVRVLRNDRASVTRGTETITIAGVDQVHALSADLPATLGDGAMRPPTILLAHYPSTVHSLPPGAVTLQLSGHTHAGQWRLPGWGCLYTNDHLATGHAWGLHRINGTYLYVSAGIGVSGMFLFRINCPPELMVFTLRAETPIGAR